MLWRTVVLLILVAIAAWTDLRERKLYNWNTYTGMLIGLVIHLLPGSPLSVGDVLLGWLACGGLMLVAFTFLPMGGGDVKLMGMMGMGMGLEDGLMALLWSVTFAAILAAAHVIWQLGAWNLLRGGFRKATYIVGAQGPVPWTDEQQQVLNQKFRLGPAALLGVLVTRADLLWEL
ncbi:MAG: prepilin peptidase [Planctomycetota bacterium]|nr:MAG: prepilin peptidase [Planctomycetota bacterium]